MSNEQKARASNIAAAASTVARCDNDAKNAAALMRTAQQMYPLNSWEVQQAEKIYHAAVIARDAARAQAEELHAATAYAGSN